MLRGSPSIVIHVIPGELFKWDYSNEAMPIDDANERQVHLPRMPMQIHANWLPTFHIICSGGVKYKQFKSPQCARFNSSQLDIRFFWLQHKRTSAFKYDAVYMSVADIIPLNSLAILKTI